MIAKVINKIKKIGLKKTIRLINERIYQKTSIDLNITLNQKNKLEKEWMHYWKSYKYIEKKYKKKVLALEKKKGTGKFSNKVWWCWLQGEENAPKLQKKCLKTLRENLVDREIIVITQDNLYEYVDFPDFIKEKYKKGIISHTHFSDLVRLELLIRHGGTWIDSTTYCTGYDEMLFDKPLFVFKNLNYIWYAHKKDFNQRAIIADNWFITAEIGNPILEAVRDLLFDYWSKHNYLTNYFIFHYLFTLVVTYKYSEEFAKIDNISHLLPHLLQFICLEEYNKITLQNIIKQSSVHKLTHKIPENEIKENSYLNTIIKDKEYKVVGK